MKKTWLYTVLFQIALWAFFFFSMDLNIVLGAVSQGLLWSILALGVYITYRILDYADLTTEGSFPLGAAVCAKFIVEGFHPIAATLFALISGILAGFITGFFHTKLKIPSLLSGILTMTGLYSINLRIMGKANLPLLKKSTVITAISDFGISSSNAVLLLGILCVLVTILILFALFHTELGFALRATGDNPHMVRALGVNTNRMTLLGLMLGNALIAVAGGLIAQFNGYADVGMGTGTIVIGLASVIMGEEVFGKSSILTSLASVVFGSLLYRVIIAFVLDKGQLPPTDLKLFSAVILALFLFLPTVKKRAKEMLQKSKKNPLSEEGN